MARISSTLTTFGQRKGSRSLLIGVRMMVRSFLPRYEKRLGESIGEQGHKVDHPTPQQASDYRAATVPLRWGWLERDDIRRSSVPRFGRRKDGHRRGIRSEGWRQCQERLISGRSERGR